MSVVRIGTCGNCGGPVEIPEVWMCIYPPTPTCRQCGATPKEAFGKRMEMNPPPGPGVKG
jgi:hypothetical protein